MKDLKLIFIILALSGAVFLLIKFGETVQRVDKLEQAVYHK